MLIKCVGDFLRFLLVFIVMENIIIFNFIGLSFGFFVNKGNGFKIKGGFGMGLV